MSIKSRILNTAEALGGAAEMVSSVGYWIVRKPDGIDHLFKQMVRVGVESIPIVFLASLFTGMVLALQSGVASIRLFNQPVFMGTLVSFTMVLELGPVLTAMVVAGRVGASISAEIGTMKVTEQLDALYTLGTTPERYLVTPLFISMLLMLPVLTLFADLLGILGGYIVTVFSFGIPGSVYMNDVISHLRIIHFTHGIIKSVFFAFMIVTVSTYVGLNTRGGAEGVGKSTTRAVVISMMLILVSDYFLTVLLNAMGII